MKTKIFKFGRHILGLLVLIFAVYIPLSHIYSNENKISNLSDINDSNKFMVGIINNGVEDADRYYRLTDSLLCNTWHRYGPWMRGPSWFNGDNLNADISVYKDSILRIINDNKAHNMRTLFMREKLLYLCFGQRSDYQCEASGFDNDLLPYTYKEHNTGTDITDNSSFGNNCRVRFCSTIPSYGHNQGYVCRELRANREQINIHPNWGEYAVDGLYNWYVKPRIRIDTVYANNPANYENNVCRVEVLNFVGDTILKKDIKVKQFKVDEFSLYNGNYMEEFYWRYDPPFMIDTNKKFNPTNEELWIDTGKVDFRIYWYGQCDMWFDYVRVDNETAHKLFQGFYDNFWLDWEVNQIASPNSDNIDRFYIEEFEFNQIPCMKYVSDYIKSVNPNFSLMFDINIPTYSAHKEDFGNYYGASHIKKFLYDPIQPKEVFSFSYPLLAMYNDSSGNPVGNHYIPSTLPGKPGIPLVFNPLNEILASPTSPANYDNYLNNLLEYAPDENNRGTMRTLDELSKTTNLPLIFMPQGHLVYWQYHQRKEPTNEELALLTYLGLAYGAKGILHYSYNGYGCPVRIANDSAKIMYERGFYNPTGDSCNLFGTPRDTNAYGQLKWQNVKGINKHLIKWGEYLLKFNIASRRSYSYGFATDRNDLINNSYFYDVLTYKPSADASPCEDVVFDSLEYRTTILQECAEERFIQVCTFDITGESYDKYFMLLNRRCSPFINETSQDNNGGRRLVKIKFDQNSSTFSGFNNWAIIDLYKDSVVKVFDKSNSGFLDLGWFMPAEARLYKISPVFPNGGTLAGDETLSGNVNCNGMIYNGGHNITISPNAVVTFSDSAGIEMNGGSLNCGVNADNADDVTLTGKTETTFWKGITLIGCDSIGVYNTNITNIKANDTAKAFSIINSYKVNFRKNTINANSNSGGIQAVYNTFSDNPIVFNVRECTFNMNQCGYSAISIFSNASVTLPIVTEWCLFKSQNDTSNAILFTEVTGGAIKNNTFTDFGKSVVLMYSATDLYGNTILGKNNSQGILCLSGSYASLSPTSGQYLGGYNYIKNYGTTASNVYSNNSYFNIQNGQNDFDLSDIDNSKHLTGDLSGMPYSYVNAMKNCFHKDSVTNIDATHSVVWYDNSPVNFVFTDYSCELTPPGDYYVYQYSGYNDTVYYRSGGEGSGYNPNKPNKPMNIEENVYKSLKDSININLRKRNYLTVEDKAKQLLTQYPDSLESATMVQKLYMASLSLDSTKIGITKTFLENLISANTQNPTLIKRAFYFIQKCKVKLGQYQSALDGFQYIMTQNPYTYEGLVASWDYAATYLLMGSGGSYKGELEQTTEELNTPADTLLNRMTRSDINTNKSKNTNSNRNSTEQITKTFYEKIKNVTKDDKAAQEEKVKTLEKKIETTKSKNEKSEAITELATMKQIKEIVKLKKPNTIVTHTAIINNDIKKVFGIGKKNSNETTNSLVPQTYALYQNYPNPFNPTTKIAYDLPKDAKVKLVIYDILGREMKTLVNNEFRSAGKYITEFNGSNLASGIYFARILVNEGKDFMAVKKMVLIK